MEYPIHPEYQLSYLPNTHIPIIHPRKYTLQQLIEMAQNNPISIRNPSPFLQHPGKPTIPWRTWIHIFDNYLTAAGLNDLAQARRKAILLNAIGTEGQRIFYTLPQAAEKTFDQTRQALAEYFSDALNVVAERHRFRSRGQLPEESIETWISTLRDLASNCDWRYVRSNDSRSTD